jgi:hypothetical protein
MASPVAGGGSTLSANLWTAIDGDLCSFYSAAPGHENDRRCILRCHYGWHRQPMIAAAG